MSESEENFQIVRKMYTLILAADTHLVNDKRVDMAWMRMKKSLDGCDNKKREKEIGYYGCNVLLQYYSFLY